MKKYGLIIIFLVIFACGVLLRFVNYDNRWTLSQDQARDVIIAHISLQSGNFPLIGPPSSVGQFSFGPIYYWLIIFFSAIFPIINGPWIGFTLLSLIPIFLFYLIGNDIKDQKLGLILAALTAFSSGLVFHSVDMLNPIPVIWATTLVIFCLIKLIDKRQIIYGYFLGLSIGLAISFHYQALGLLVVPIVASLLNNFFRKKKVFVFFSSVLGILTTLIPLIIFNFQVGGKLLENFLGFSSGSNVTVRTILGLGKDLLVFWPQLWGEVLVRKWEFGYLFYICFVVIVILAVFKKSHLPKSWWVILISMILQAVIFRFYGGVRAPIYLLVFYPFIIFLTGFAIWFWWEKKKLLGFGLLVIFILASSWENFYVLKGHTQKPLIYEVKKLIDEKHRESIDLYTMRDSGMISLPLYYLLLKENRISPDGYQIGACANRILENNLPFCPMQPTPFFGKENYAVYDLNTTNPEDVLTSGFERLTREEIYSWLFDYYRR